MKKIAFILALFLFGSSINAAGLAKYMFNSTTTYMNCCSSEESTDKDCNETDQKDDCCEDGSCLCLCCIPCVLNNSAEEVTSSSTYLNHTFILDNLYHKEFLHLVFHPPSSC